MECILRSIECGKSLINYIIIKNESLQCILHLYCFLWEVMRSKYRWIWIGKFRQSWIVEFWQKLDKRAVLNKRAGTNFAQNTKNCTGWKLAVLFMTTEASQLSQNEPSKQRLPKNKPSFCQKHFRLCLNIWQHYFKNPEK